MLPETTTTTSSSESPPPHIRILILLLQVGVGVVLCVVWCVVFICVTFARVLLSSVCAVRLECTRSSSSCALGYLCLGFFYATFSARVVFRGPFLARSLSGYLCVPYVSLKKSFVRGVDVDDGVVAVPLIVVVARASS